MKHWTKRFSLFILMLGIVGEGGAIAQTSTNIQLAEVRGSARRGECYVVETRSTPVFTRADSNERPRLTLRENETVYLAEDNKNYTLIKVEIPGERDEGYVTASDLEECERRRDFNLSGCRLSLRGDRTRDFLRVYDDPSDNSRTNGLVRINEPVTIYEGIAEVTAENEEWVKIRQPIEGWLINRFSQSRVDNLEGCRIRR